MISKRIEYILWLLATDNTQLAAYAGCSESNFSRLKSGARNPSRDSLTVKKFVGAVYAAARDKAMLGSLLALTNEQDSSEEALCASLTAWLFDGNDDSLPYSPRELSAKQFGEKLTLAMKKAGLSNSRLSRDANIDPSYISRMKNGTRMPKNNPELIDRLCRIIAQKAAQRKAESELFELTGQPEGNTDDLAAALFGWLYDKKSTEGALAAGRLIDTIAAIPEARGAALSGITDIPEADSSAECYIGAQGLQSAVTRFLKNASRSGNRELLLYSDQPMSWMSGSFRQIWLGLMKECFESNVSIKIIHNIDRSIAEMLDGIRSWLPLYMTGLISSYYNTARAGERFYSTIFLDSGAACIEGHFITGMEGGARYRYITSPEELDYQQKSFDMLMQDCKPLIRMIKGELSLSGSYNIYSLEGISLCIGEGQVIVSKLSSPKMSFCFEHPLMVKAFRAYVKEDNI